MRVKDGERVPFFYGAAYEDIERKERIFLLFPFNYLVQLALVVYVKLMYAFKKPSWFDKQLQVVFKKGFEMGYKQAYNDLQDRKVVKRYLNEESHKNLMKIKHIN
jgi:glutamine amidotransferase-like uncharacterized protein